MLHLKLLVNQLLRLILYAFNSVSNTLFSHRCIQDTVEKIKVN